MKFLSTKIGSRFGVKSRIFSLIFLSVLLTAILSITYLYGDGVVEDELVQQATITEASEISLAINISALQMRRREKDFLLRRDVKYRDKYLAEVSLIQDSLQQMKELGLKQVSNVALEQIGSGVAAHQVQFLKVFALHEQLGLNEKVGLQGQLRKAVHDVEEQLKKADLKDLTVKMLMMRRHEKDFMLRGAEKYVGRVDKRRKEFAILLAQKSLSDDVKAKISNLMDAYQAGVRAYAATALELAGETKKLSKIFSDMEPSFAALEQATGLAKTESSQTLADWRETTKSWFFLSVVGGLLAACYLGWRIGRSISMPLNNLAIAMAAITKGDTSVVVPHRQEENEIGYMAKAIDVFKQNAIRNKELEDKQQGMKAQAEKERKELLDKLASDFDSNVGGIIESVSAASTQLKSTAQAMSGLAEETKSQSDTVLTVSEETTSNVGAVATASDEMSASINEINSQVSHASIAANDAVRNVETTGTQIEGLVAMANRIGDVVKIISDIADQTNLLALNATIESARAGEAGRGFAVVANEVKALAGQTTKATEEIGQQVEAIQKATEGVVVSMTEIRSVIHNVDETSSAIASAIEEQGATTQNIAQNVQHAADGTRQVTDSINNVSRASQEAGMAAGEVTKAANDLFEMSGQLQGEVDKFTQHIRAS